MAVQWTHGRRIGVEDLQRFEDASEKVESLNPNVVKQRLDEIDELIAKVESDEMVKAALIEIRNAFASFQYDLTDYVERVVYKLLKSGIRDVVLDELSNIAMVEKEED